MKRSLHLLMEGLLFVGSLSSCSREAGPLRELRSEADLSGLTISMTAGNYYDEKYSSREDVTLFRVNSETDGIQAIRQGMADVFVTDDVSISPETCSQWGIRLAFVGEESFDVAFALRKGNEGLREELNRFLTQSKTDGTLSAVIDHWIKGSPAPELPDSAGFSRTEPLRCVTSMNSAPVCFLGEDGVWMGIDADILRRFALWSGRSFEMDFKSFDSAVIALNTGQCDLLSACLYITEDREKSVDFSIPYYACRPGYFVPEREQPEKMGLGERLKLNLVNEDRWKLIVDGLLETIRITFFSILLGTLLGIGVCAMLRSRRWWIRTAARVYGAILQGIPTLVLLLFMFYVILAHTGVNATLVAILTFALFFSWSAGSLFDSAISSVPRGQTEAGLSLGFTPMKTFLGIVFPQALQRGLPHYAGACVELLKGTSIVGYIAIQDLTRASDLIRSRTFDALVPLLVVTLLYFVLAWLIRFLLTLSLKK
jgi:polar amino acid transport system substrate-binding protein